MAESNTKPFGEKQRALMLSLSISRSKTEYKEEHHDQQRLGSAHFEEVMQQKIIDGAVEAAVQAMRTECRKSNNELTPEAEQKVRLGSPYDFGETSCVVRDRCKPARRD